MVVGRDVVMWFLSVLGVAEPLPSRPAEGWGETPRV